MSLYAIVSDPQWLVDMGRKLCRLQCKLCGRIVYTSDPVGYYRLHERVFH